MDKNSRFTVLVSLIVALGGFLMGFDASVISGVVGFIEPYFGLTKIELGWAVSCLTLTSTLAMMTAGPVSDAIGRKQVLIFAAIIYAISAITSAMATEFWFFIIARMLGGFGVGASLIVAPMYIAEISPAKIRGKMVSFNQLNIVLGISAAFFSNFLILKITGSDTHSSDSLINSDNSWRLMLGVETLPALMYFLCLFIVPESPRWLAIKGQNDKALQILKKASGETAAIKDFAAITESIQNDSHKEKGSFKELFKPALRLVMLIGIVVAITQQITGINSVFFYAPMIFEQSGIGKDAAFSQAIYVGLINLVFTIVAMWLIDKLGRKPLLIIGITGVALSMFLISYTFSTATYQLKPQTVTELNLQVESSRLSEIVTPVYQSETELMLALEKEFGKEKIQELKQTIASQSVIVNPVLVLIGILGFVASFAISLGPVMWVLFSELFPNRLRGIAISFAGFINSAISFLVQLVFPWELANLGNPSTFLIYGLFAVVGLVFIALLLPETKGKSLEELEKILIKGQ